MSVLEINLAKISQNTNNIISLLKNIEVVAVVKACQGDKRVARAVIEGGAGIIADSQAENLLSLKKLKVKKMLLMPPRHTEDLMLENIDYLLVSNNDDILHLNRVVRKRLEVILLVESGFKREGFNPNELDMAVTLTNKAKKLHLAGFATTTACQKAGNSLKQLKYFTKAINSFCISPSASHLPFVVSGGNSSVLPLALKGAIPKEINQLRIGEAILLGNETVNYKAVANNFTDAFVLKVPIVEERYKGGKRVAVIATGIRDVGAGIIMPIEEGIGIINKLYSEYATFNVEIKTKLGSSINFKPDYYALLALMNSKYVEKRYLNSINS